MNLQPSTQLSGRLGKEVRLVVKTGESIGPSVVGLSDGQKSKKAKKVKSFRSKHGFQTSPTYFLARMTCIKKSTPGFMCGLCV